MYFYVICLKIIISLRYGSRTEEPSGGNISRCLMRKTLKVRKINVTIGQCWIPFCRSTSGKLIFSMLFFQFHVFTNQSIVEKYMQHCACKSTCKTKARIFARTSVGVMGEGPINAILSVNSQIRITQYMLQITHRTPPKQNHPSDPLKIFSEFGQ